MFLVLLRCSMDDLPLRLFKTNTEAVEFAKQYTDQDADRIEQLLVLDRSDDNCIFIVEFNSTGNPIDANLVRDFGNEPSQEQIEHDSVVTCPECETAIYPKWKQGVLYCPECRAAVRNYGIGPVRSAGNEIPND